LDNVVQTGSFVCSPKYHKDIFDQIYNNYEDTHGAEWNYEMPAMSYELVKNNIVHWISPSFNFCVGGIMAAFYPNELNKRIGIFNRIKKIFGFHSTNRKNSVLENIYSLSIFMHFAGCNELMYEMVGIINE